MGTNLHLLRTVRHSDQEEETEQICDPDPIGAGIDATRSVDIALACWKPTELCAA